MARRDSFILELIYFAVGCAALGVLFAFILVFALQYFRIDVYKHLWLLLIPLVLSIALNILAIELYGRYKRKKRRP
jgi:membrane protein DedA with SNARE-associated domain